MEYAEGHLPVCLLRYGTSYANTKKKYGKNESCRCVFPYAAGEVVCGQKSSEQQITKAAQKAKNS